MTPTTPPPSKPLPAVLGGRYDVVWTTPAKDHTGSVPLGNGDVGLNAWIEPNGDLCFYIGKTDSWDDNGRLLKVGKVRLRCTPPLFEAGGEFHQRLDLASATLHAQTAVAGRRATLRVWVAAEQPVIQVSVDSETPVGATATIEMWRTKAQRLPKIEVSDVDSPVLEPDEYVEGLTEGIGWLHCNRKSAGFTQTRTLQGLADFPMPDPLLQRTFGAVLLAASGERMDERTLRIPPANSVRLRVYVLTRHPAGPDEWRKGMRELIARVEALPPERQRAGHEAWWREFWTRSWMDIESRGPAAPLIERNDLPLLVGTDQRGESRFQGQLGRIGVFQRILAEAEVAALAAGGREPLSARKDLLGSWVDPVPGARLEALAPADLAGPLTFEAWIRPEAPAGTGGRILDKIAPGGHNGFLLDAWPANSLRLIAGKQTLQLPRLLKPGSWAHVAVTADPARREWRLFLDGRPVAESRAEADAEAVSRAYQLQRYVNACGGRGAYPIKFNGSLFTVPFDGAPGDADYRRWGPGYWWQNTRLPYCGMCASGDFDLMEPLFRLYVDELLGLCRFRTRKYLGHEGAFYPECMYFWGAVFTETYGPTPFEKRSDKLQDSRWHKWEWVAGLELVWMMLDYFEHTQDEEFLRRRLLPAAREVLAFFGRHYPTGADGKLVLHPAQALETWWDCTNPMPEVAGLLAVTDRLRRLPERLTEDRDREFWATLKGKLPDLPTTEVNGVRTLAPAAKYDQKKNIENPELYAVFPFRLVSFEGPAAEMGREAYRRRQDPGNSGWRQDALFAAYLGLTEEVRRQVADRAQNKDKHSRFPAFWGPNYDWVPDQCHGGVLMKAVQAMLMQSDGNKIIFFPAWPAEWKVSFRLHAPFGTVVTGFGRDGQLEQLSVLPETRRKDITVLPVR